MKEPLVTILVPNYRTPELTRLCLRLIRKHTDPDLGRVIVIDNDSKDASVEYLRTLRWITLIERSAEPDDTPALSHSRALDLALNQVESPFVLSIHTDTLVKRGDWLQMLLGEFEGREQVAGVGSWKLESKTFLRRAAKRLERGFQLAMSRIPGTKPRRLEGVGKEQYYLRSHCAMYRTSVIRELNTGFSDGAEVAGRVMHQKMLAARYEMHFLASEMLSRYVEHINHATMVLNPALGSRPASISSGAKRIDRTLREIGAARILSDSSLDA